MKISVEKKKKKGIRKFKKNCLDLSKPIGLLKNSQQNYNRIKSSLLFHPY